ncbi:NUDIX hydrolase [Candidatus Protofrankia californiensis]|uniref:NUDIX hydrolase n=1 Tax=Candidatus Protofrankia californiensis TaxID=1839754 RepID=A0A1C3NSN9_9ACTN|nr:NUDIX hydrolase [Candidatus Protofrankia californiensis]
MPVNGQDYTPVDVTPPELQPAGIAADARTDRTIDTATDPTAITDWKTRQTRALVPFRVVDGYPQNPAGRTGRVGRRLWCWGENQAVDPLVVTGVGEHRRVLLIRRGDCGQWAMPGGMVDPGETVPQALVRELREETGVDLTGAVPVVLARVYVDDPRNTDHAWIASTVAFFQVAVPVRPQAGSDARDAGWFPFPDIGGLRTAIHTIGDRLYPAHDALLTEISIP